MKVWIVMKYPHQLLEDQYRATVDKVFALEEHAADYVARQGQADDWNREVLPMSVL